MRSTALRSWGSIPRARSACICAMLLSSLNRLQPAPLGYLKASATWVSQTISKLNQLAPDAWPCWAFSNHDVTRHATRWNLNDDAMRCYATLLMCLKGSACIYQGEELGLSEADVPFEALKDPYGIEFWPEFKGRDGCRTPMVWDAGASDAGFGSTSPWLPISEAQKSRAVSTQINDRDSLLTHYKQAIALRRQLPALQTGEQSPLSADGNILSFKRSLDGQTVHCIFNLSNEPGSIDLAAGRYRDIGSGVRALPDPKAGPNKLGPWECILAEESP